MKFGKCHPTDAAGSHPLHYIKGRPLHGPGCETQALVIGHNVPQHTSGAWFPALVFDREGRRIMTRASLINLVDKGWHVAETFEVIGLNIPDPAPHLQPFDYPCSCGVCGGDCGRRFDSPFESCASCDSHPTCSCPCGCEDGCMNDFCGYCDGTYICTNCESSHAEIDDLCESCDDEKRYEDEQAKAAAAATEEPTPTTTVTISTEGDTSPS